MFFKKRQAPVDTEIDKKIKSLITDIEKQRSLIEGRTRNVVIKNGVIQCYEEGTPDWERAVEDAEKAKRNLSRTVSEYDKLLEALSLAYTENAERRTTVGWVNIYSTSHEMVEIFYERTIRRC